MVKERKQKDSFLILPPPPSPQMWAIPMLLPNEAAALKIESLSGNPTASLGGLQFKFIYIWGGIFLIRHNLFIILLIKFIGAF